MLLYWGYCYLILIVSTACLFLILDEEPVFDLTDLNLLHVILLTLSIFSIFFDNYSRVSLGQIISKDVSLFSYVISYTINLILYVLVVWFFFFIHVSSPFSLSLVDDAQMSFNFISILSPVILKNSIFLIVIWFLSFLLSKSVSHKAAIYVIFSCSLASLLSVVFLIFDFVSSQLTSSQSKFTGEVSFYGNKSSSTYDTTSSNGAFEWSVVSSKGHLLYNLDYASMLSFFLIISWFLVFIVFLLLVIVFSYDRKTSVIVNKTIIGFFLSFCNSLFLFWLALVIYITAPSLITILTTVGFF